MIYAYEQIGSFFEYLGKRFKSAVAIGSEYLGEEYAPGSIVNGIRHENALHLSFDDKSFDVLISCDVFEHVPDIDRVFAEAFRVLKEGGYLFFTVPFDARIYASVTRAQRKGKEIDFLCPPEYHGNPIDPKGSLVFYDFGWDILDRCKGVGFVNAYAVSCWDANSGFLGGSGQYVFVAKKRNLKPADTL
jgi:SAM-dependent methyltransferase